MAQTNRIDLPDPRLKGEMSLEETIARRRSRREYLEKELTLEQIGQVLWAAQGITGKRDDVDLRAAPSPGAKYAMELYVLTKDGLFRYVPKGHYLEVRAEGDLRGALTEFASRQEIIKHASMTIVLSAAFDRVTERFGERGRMYAHMEAGHIVQNVQLQAVALGLSSVPMGAFQPDKVADLLSIPDGQEVIYMVPVGYVK